MWNFQGTLRIFRDDSLFILRLFSQPFNDKTYFRLCQDFFTIKSLTKLNGDKEIRTLDPLLARQVLSQLSYIPSVFISIFIFNALAFSQSQWA